MIPRDEIQRHYLMPEAELVARLSDETGLDNASRRSISQDAENLVRKVRGTGDVGIGHVAHGAAGTTGHGLILG